MSDLTRPDALLQRGLKLSHLRLIAALEAQGQLGLAAQQLGITQPAASRLLSEIEKITTSTMHLRTGRGLALTAAGAALARRAQRILVEMNEAARDIAATATGGAGAVSIGSVTAPALDLVLPALRAARLSHPAITAEVTVAPSDQLCAQLRAGTLDFAIARVPATMDARDFDAITIAPEPVALVVRRNHRLALATAVAPQDLLDYDWVMPGRGSLLATAVLDRLAALGLPPPTHRVSTSSFLLTLAMIRQTNAVAPLADAVARQFASSDDAPFAILPLLLGIEVRPYALLTRAGAAPTPAAALLLRLIANGAGL
jgi:DNA-binding transcriptional LysR family regulator